MRIERVRGYRHLTAADLDSPGHGNVFVDPPDTEVAAWAGADVVTTGCTVFDLGSGSGATAAALVRAGAGHAHGVDVSEESVAWARKCYSTDAPGARVSFAVADFVALPTPELLATSPGTAAPSVVASNPPYVPLPGPEGRSHVSIDGGPDGLRFVPAVLEHARHLGADVALTLGSYCDLRRAARRLADADLFLRTVTLSALSLGSFTRRHPERVRELERAGAGVLWRPPGDEGYLIVGMACTREPPPPGTSRCPTPEEIFAIVAAAAASRTTELEGLATLSVDGLDRFPVRVLDLPAPSERHHW